MFDFIGAIPKQKNSNEIRINLSEDFLDNIEYKKYEIKVEQLEFNYLKRDNDDRDDLLLDNDVMIAVLGNAFTNRAYQVSTGLQPNKLDSTDIKSLFQTYSTQFIQYIKGIFQLIIYDRKSQELFLFNSRFGLLEFYFFEDDNKFLFSSSASFIRSSPHVELNLDKIAVLQHILFDYPLGDRTHFIELKVIPPGKYLHVKKNGDSNLNRYYDFDNLINTQKEYNWEETYKLTPDLFNEIVDMYSSLDNKLCSSLTGGYDSRTVLSRLANLEKDVLYYTWGMAESGEIQVAREITTRLSLNYQPVLLDAEFESNYEFFAHQAVYKSEGRGTVRRANHTYGYSKLFKHSGYALTGLFGSELLRPANCVGHIYNQNFIDVLFSANREEALQKLIDKTSNLLKKDFIENYSKDFLAECCEYFKQYETIKEKYKILYKFSLYEGFRKYFGHEIHGCRMYLDILSPYIDDDFVAFIFKTPVPELDNEAFKRNNKSLKLGHAFYFPILEKNLPLLMNIMMSRNFSPAQVKSRYYPFTVLYGHMKSYIYYKLFKVDNTFNTNTWVNSLIKKSNWSSEDNSDIFSPMNRYEHSGYRFKAMVYSLYKWLYSY